MVDDRLITEEMERALLFPPLSFYGEMRAAVCLRPAQYFDRALSNSFTEANGLFFCLASLASLCILEQNDSN